MFDIKNIIIKNKKMILYIASFLLPLFSLLIIYNFLEIYPFGNKSLLTIDMGNQYISFFAYFKSVLDGDSSLFYSFSRILGGEMVGLTTYYLLSPFNLIFKFSSLENLPFFIFLLTLLKISFSSVTMFYYLSKENKEFISLVLSLCYSMMGYNIIYQQNIMWLDGVILLPLVIYGIEKILKQEKVYYYSIFLAISIMTNYYIGFMICIFSVIYFIANLLTKIKRNSLNFKYIKSIVIKFVSGSLLAGGISAIVILPTFSSLQGGKAKLSLDILNFNSNFNLIDLLSKFFIGSFNYEEIKNGLPNVYISTLVIILVLLFFINPKIKSSKKTTWGIIFFTLIVSFKINFFNLIWHGLNYPNWFPYRYSFIFNFVLVVMASISFRNYNVNNKVIKKIAVCLIVVSLLLEKFNYPYLNSSKIYLTIFFCLLLLIISYVCQKNVKKYFYKLLILLIVVVEVSLNGFLVLKNNEYYPMDDYKSFIRTNENIIDNIKETDQEFYRIEKNYQFNTDDSLLLGYNGLSHYSSSEKEFIKTFMGNMGYRNHGIWARYSKGSSLAANSFLGVKYILSKDRELNNYQLLDKKGDIFIYKNKYALPLGFMTSKSIDSQIEFTNVFEYQNKIYTTLGSKEDIFSSVPKENIKRELNNLELITVENKHQFKKINENEKASIDFFIKNSKNKNKLVNFYFNINEYTGAKLYVDDKYIGNDFTSGDHTVNIAPTNNKKEIKITVELLSTQLSYTEELFYYQNTNVLEKNLKRLQSNSLDIIEQSDSYIKGKVVSSADNNQMLLTIPFDENWRIEIDGKKVDAYKVYNTLIGVNVPLGEHVIELTYKPKGVVIGISITLLTLIGISCSSLYEKNKKSKLKL